MKQYYPCGNHLHEVFSFRLPMIAQGCLPTDAKSEKAKSIRHTEKLLIKHGLTHGEYLGYR